MMRQYKVLGLIWKAYLIVRDKFCGVSHREDAQEGGIISPFMHQSLSA